jgi:hypothetical protein
MGKEIDRDLIIINIQVFVRGIEENHEGLVCGIQIPSL